MTVEELYDLLLSNRPSDNLRLHEDELFDLIPELKKCKGFKQNNEWHVYDVYDHLLHVVDNVKPNLIMRLSALFHDIGKPLTYKEDKNKVGHFYGHWEVSQKIFLSFANKYNIEKKVCNRISSLIYYHDITTSKLDHNELKKMIGSLSEEGIEQLYELKRADLLAQNEKFHYIMNDYPKQKEELLLKIKVYDNKDK